MKEKIQCRESKLKKYKVLYNFLKTLIQKNKKTCMNCFFIMIIVTVLNIMLPKIIQFIIDDAIINQKIRLLLTMGSIYLVISILNSALIILKESMISRVKKEIAVHFKLLMLKKLSRFSGKYLSNLKTGEMINLINDDIYVIENYGIDIIFNLASNIITGILALYILFSMEKDMLIIVILLQLLTIFLQLKFTGILTKRTREIREEAGGLYNLIQQYIANIFQIIISKSRAYFLSNYINRKRKFIRKNILLDILYVANNELGQVLSILITIFIYIYGGYKIILGEMTIGQLIAFQQYTWMFISPCLSILKSNTNIQKMRISLERIYGFLDTSVDIKQNNHGRLVNSKINTIKFNNVKFSYDKEIILKNINFTLLSGKTYAFVGETGSGKSTLINLLYRLWDVNNGEILIDNVNLEEYNLQSLRKNISIVSQNLYMIDDTIEKNLTLGNSNITEMQYKLVCKNLSINKFIEDLPDGYQTLVGENGIKLSGGQKQRIIIGRMLLESKSILIFDEATSALDNITQNNILNNVKDFYKDKIVLIIAHRLSTIKNADKIFVIKEGEICQEGSHDKLMDEKGYYYKLVTEQDKGEENVAKGCLQL